MGIFARKGRMARLKGCRKIFFARKENVRDGM